MKRRILKSSSEREREELFNDYLSGMWVGILAAGALLGGLQLVMMIVRL